MSSQNRLDRHQLRIARLIVVLFALTAVLAGCGGKGASESTSLAKLVPDDLGGTELRKESYTGTVWLKARAERSFAPEVAADVSRFLNRLRKSPSDLSVAWALSDDGPKVVAYRVIGTDADALVKSFVGALPERAKIRTATAGLAGKDVTVTFGVSLFRGYLYAQDDVLYATNTSHVSTHELEELLSKLP